MREMIKTENAAAYTKRLLREGAKARKSLGQNFLIDDGVIGAIVQAAGLTPGTLLVEIGPGLGTMTRLLAQEVNRMWAVELDRDKVTILRRELTGMPVEIIQADALSVMLSDLWGDQEGVLIGNLPYYITSPLLMHFLAQADRLRTMVVMVQKEVALRLAALPGGKDYGVLSVAVQVAAEVEKVTDVPPSAFWPAPEVTSTVVKLRLRSDPDFAVDRDAFFRLVKAAFGQRRKTLSNSLQAGLGLSKGEIAGILQAAGIAGGRRAETLSIEEFVMLTQAWLNR